MDKGITVKVGTDIIEIGRIQRLTDAKARFAERVFTDEERRYCEARKKGKYQSYAGIYAAKEAFLKALGTGLRYGAWTDIAVSHDESGAPVMRAEGAFKTILDKQGLNHISVSISHSRHYAMSTVILYKE